MKINFPLKKMLGLVAVVFMAYAPNAKSQTILKETTYDPAGKANIVNLQEVVIDKENNE